MALFEVASDLGRFWRCRWPFASSPPASAVPLVVFPLFRSHRPPHPTRFIPNPAPLTFTELWHIFHPDTNARTRLVNSRTYLHYPSQKRWLVFVGEGNHRAEPVAVLRRAPTLTDEQRQQRVCSRAFPPSELRPQSAKEGVRESQGLDRPRSCLLSPGKLNTGFDFVPHGQTIGTLQTLYMASRSDNQDVSLDDG